MTWQPIRKLPPRLGGFMPRVSADVAQLARSMRQQLLEREDVQKLQSVSWNPNRQPEYVVNDRNQIEPRRQEPGPSVWDMIFAILSDLPDEGFKLFPWVVREVKKGVGQDTADVTAGITYRNKRHAMDILEQAIRWMIWAKEHNRPLPDMMSKQFGFRDLEAWVYDMNATQTQVGDSPGGWLDSKVVYKFDDGWHIDEVGPQDLAREGELMGHCVGGYCDTVSSGNSTIFSLRDPKGQPHVTIEMRDARGGDVTKGYGEVDHQDRDLVVIQEQGKQNRTPIQEYKDKIDQWYRHLEDQGWNVIYSEDEEPEYVEDWNDTQAYPANHEGVGHFYDELVSDPWQFERDEDPRYEYDRGRQTVHERVPNYIGHPTQTWNDQETGEHPTTASIEDIKRSMSQTLGQLWSGNAINGQWWAQAYYAAAHHALMHNHWEDGLKKEMDDLVSFASNWVAQKSQSRPSAPPTQPTLFEPNDYFTQRAIPPAVKAFLHYLVGYEEAASTKDENSQWNPYPNYPKMPGADRWPISEFPAYFGQLEQKFPQHFTPTEQMAGTFAKKAYMIERLRKMAGYTTDWSFDPSASEFQPLHCPFDGHELEVRLHGGAECLSCGHEFELGHDGTILPSDNTVEERSHEWPDSLPWGESEQDFYRHAMVCPT